MRQELAAIPGYLNAVKRENDIRDAAFLALPARICGISVRPMTLRHWLILDGIDSYFLKPKSGPPNADDISAFLWVLSPQFDARSGARWDRILRRCGRVPILRALSKRIASWCSARGRFVDRVGKLPYGKMVAGIEDYYEKTFQDSPPSSGNDDEDAVAQISFAANLLYSVASLTHWSREVILELPLRETFQYLTIKRMLSAARRGETFTGWNPSDKVKRDYIRECRRRWRESQAKMSEEN